MRAIDAKVAVELVYERDRGAGSRICRPHILFENAKGSLLVDVFQTEGYSSQGDLPAWRQLFVDQLVDVRLLPDAFDEPAEGYTDNVSRYTRILCEWQP